jgi:hypothetical protein
MKDAVVKEEREVLEARRLLVRCGFLGPFALVSAGVGAI